LTDRRRLGNEIAQLLGMVSMGASMATARVEDPQARELVTALAGMLTKLGPVAATIDFIEATAAVTTFDGTAWHTRKVIHYAAYEEPPAEVSL